MRWSEIAPDLSVWTMSGARMKNRKPHDVHLSRPARAVLRALSEARSKDSKGGKGEICDFVFSTTGKTSISGFARAKARLDAAIAEGRAKAAATESTPLVPWRLHDLRRTGASTLARLGFDTIAIDRLLAHRPTKLRVSPPVAAIYQRYDFAQERARALDAWAEHVLTSNVRQRERTLDTAMLVVVGTDRPLIRKHGHHTTNSRRGGAAGNWSLMTRCERGDSLKRDKNAREE